ncbi:hypothetical protein V8F20_007059 [Naviculisporaceae sp. PSN 640]
MTFWNSYKALSPLYKAGFGVGLLAWGYIGLQMTPKTEETLGLVPSEQDLAAIEKYKPKIMVIDRNEFSSSKDDK